MFAFTGGLEGVRHINRTARITLHGALTEVLGPLSEDETHAIFEGTARRFYGISA